MRKVWDTIKSILVWLVFLASVIMMLFTIISVKTVDRGDRTLFGYMGFVVQSDSMSAADFNVGDLILVKRVDPATLRAGDIITFRSTDRDSFNETVTHKIRRIAINAAGKPCFITYGVTTNTDDRTPVTYENVIGQYRCCIPGVGVFFAFLKTIPGYFCCFFLPFAIIIAMQTVSTVRLFRQYRAEQQEFIEAEGQSESDDPDGSGSEEKESFMM